MAIELSHINESEYNEILQQAVALFDTKKYLFKNYLIFFLYICSVILNRYSVPPNG